MELEVTLTPEAEVSSTVVNNSFQSNDGDSSNSNPTFSKSINTMPTVIPPTTIVCLPSIVSISNPVITRQHGMPVTSSSVIQNIGDTKIKVEDQSSSPISILQHKHYQSLQKVFLQNQQILQQHNQQVQQQQHQQQQLQSQQSSVTLQQQQQSTQQNLQSLINQNSQQKPIQVC